METVTDKKQSKPKCWNCKHAGDRFKLSGGTHMHCHNPETHTPEDAGWGTLHEGCDTCKNHEYREAK